MTWFAARVSSFAAFGRHWIRMSTMTAKNHRGSAALLMAICLLAGGTAGADVYKYRDAYGRIHLTDQPMSGNVQLLKIYRLGGSRGGASNSDAELRQRRRTWAPLIERVAREQQLHPELLHAVVRVESAYDPKAVSSKGAVGLMQLMPATAARFGVSDREDPQQNLKAGARYLRELLGMFDNDLTLALAAYNAGENAVIRYGNRVPPFPETRDYVRKVQSLYGQREGSATIERSLAVR